MDQATLSEIMGPPLEVRRWGICSVTLGPRMKECAEIFGSRLEVTWERFQGLDG